METRLGVYGWGLSCQPLDFFTGDRGQVLFCQEARLQETLHGCALPPPGTKLQPSQSRDLVPTWPVGDGCNTESPALIAKAGVSKAPEIPGAQGTGMCADFIRRWAVAAILQAAQAGCKEVGSMAGEGGRGRANCCNLVRQPSYFPKEKPRPRQAAPSVGNPQEEPRQTCAVLVDVPGQGCKQDPNCLSGFQTQAKMASFQSLESLIVTPEYQHLKYCL